MSRLRVLLLHNCIAPYRVSLFRQLSQLYDFGIMLCGDGQRRVRNGGSVTSASDLTTIQLRAIQFPIPFAGNAVLTRGVRDGIAAFRPDCVIVPDDLPHLMTSFSAMTSARAAGIPTIVWTGSIGIPSARAGYLRHFWRRAIEPARHLLYQQADAILAYGRRTLSWLEQLRVPPGKVFAGTQSVEETFMPTALEATRSADRNGITISSLSNLYRYKGVEYLVRAFRQLEGGNLQLLVGGGGPERRRLEQLAAGDVRIRFAGPVTGLQKARLFQSTHIFVLPTLMDIWGLVVNEAMSYGIPIVVCSTAGCSSELVDGNGFVVPPADVEAIREALRTLINSPEKRMLMGRRSRDIIGHYTIEHAVISFQQAITYVTGKP